MFSAYDKTRCDFNDKQSKDDAVRYGAGLTEEIASKFIESNARRSAAACCMSRLMFTSATRRTRQSRDVRW
jgi:hypothetical protein